MGKIFCSQCGSEHNDSDSFCEKCGKPLINTKPTTIQKNKSSNDKLIILALIGVIILLGVGILASGVLTPKIPLKHMDFGVFEIDVPEDSDFQQYDSVSVLNYHSAVYSNKGFNSEDFSTISVSTKSIENNVPVLVEQTGNMKLYKSNDMQVSKFGEEYNLILEKNGFYFSLSGSNKDLLKEVAETIVVKNTY